MGSHAGVTFFDGRPIDEAREAVAAGLESAAPDGTFAFAEPGAILGYGACHVWSGERGARQPVASPSGLVASWDGRLDNRGELRLLLADARDRDRSDAAWALAVFERFGIPGLRLLIGDWSLVVWDRRRRLLHLARDYMGVRPLYYAESDGGIAWSSSLGELARRLGRADRLDERFVAAYMTIRHSADVTPYAGIRSVPAAHCVRVSADRVEIRRFWTLDSGSIEYRDPRLYEERLRGLWCEAVSVRLRTRDPVWAELSGGLDSSSVVCAADALIKDRAVDASVLRPVSHVALHSPAGDERRFIAAVEHQIGRCSTIFALEEDEDETDPDVDWVTPLAARGVTAAMIRRVRAEGGRVVLSGRVGDAVMGCIGDNSLAVFDDLAAGRLLTALSEIRRWSRATRKPFVEILGRLIAECAPCVLSPTLARPLNDTQQRGVELLTPHVRALAESISTTALEVWKSRPRRSKRELAALLLGYSVEGRLGFPMLPPDITYTYPFVHRPLVEFVVAIPGRELSAPGVMRNVMQRSFEGLLPDSVRTRTSKGYYPPAVMRAVKTLAMAARPVERLEVVERRWIDPKRLDAAIRLLVDGNGASGPEIQRVLRLERWLRNRHGPRRSSKREEVKSHDVFNA
jgi:asparagine synthase (glutamine-hydrolysing)